MTEETVAPPEEIVQDMVDSVEQPEEAQAEVEQEQESVKEETVPLAAHIKLRRQKQELQQELEWERQRAQQSQAPQEEDLSKYESATREDLARTQEEAIRAVEERLWIRQNPERYEKVNEDLQQFLKQRPNLASAISSAPNRWEEAYTLMEALTPRQQKQLKEAASPKKDAPNSPSGVPKAASMNQGVDVMNMSDSEFAAWRNSQKKRR